MVKVAMAAQPLSSCSLGDVERQVAERLHLRSEAVGRCEYVKYAILAARAEEIDELLAPAMAMRDVMRQDNSNSVAKQAQSRLRYAIDAASRSAARAPSLCARRPTARSSSSSSSRPILSPQDDPPNLKNLVFS